MKSRISLVFLAGLILISVWSCQTLEKEPVPEVRNVILLIGDGMGASQLYAGMVESETPLFMERFPVAGFQKTYSFSDYITDSAASGTALATGKKTRNGMIGMDPDSVPVKSILELAEEQGMATGLVATVAITHATPASFIAHQVNRNMYEEIAADFLATEVDVFIGGGKDHFTRRKDSLNLLTELEARGYYLAESLEEAGELEDGKLACLLAPGHLPTWSEGRGDMLPQAAEIALNLLNHNEKGFFIMIEGSQIDWGGHANDLKYVVNETLDFDRAVGKALSFAEKDGHTLVIVTADHECGGLTHVGGSIGEHRVEGHFSTGDHTGVMVPVLAFGPGAEEFGGIYDNTDVFIKIRNLLNLEEE
ncbi:MAG: alkaline phosphatase [Bacteroidales bacterium]